MITQTTPLSFSQTRNTAVIACSPSSKYVGTGGYDGTISVFDVAAAAQNTDQKAHPVATIKAHEGPVTDVAFSSLDFGRLLASGGTDRKVAIHKECSPGSWELIHQETCGLGAITSVQFVTAPTTSVLNIFQQTALYPSSCVGLHLVVGCADGTITVLSLMADFNWAKKSWHAHTGGVNAVRWATIPTAQLSRSTEVTGEPTEDPGYSLASVGVDGHVVIWTFDQTTSTFVCDHRLLGHQRNVIDVCWMPVGEAQEEKIVSLGDDGTICLWGKPTSGAGWIRLQVLPHVAVGACKIGWSFDGSVIGVCSPSYNIPPLKLFLVVGETITELPASEQQHVAEGTHAENQQLVF